MKKYLGVTLIIHKFALKIFATIANKITYDMYLIMSKRWTGIEETSVQC
jgi:hypothetical protein